MPDDGARRLEESGDIAFRGVSNRLMTLSEVLLADGERERATTLGER